MSTIKETTLRRTTKNVKSTPAFTVRSMTLGDIEKCLRIWARVELTEARQTVASCLAVDPDAFYVAELNETGEVIGMCAGPMTRDDTAFIGFYAVEPQYQGVGVGRELWSKTLGHLESTLNVGLYGVPEMAEKYKKVGFTLEDSASMLVFESEPDSWDISSLDCLRQVNDARLALLDGSSSDLSLFETLVEYDSQIHGYSRRNLLCQYLLGQDTPLTVTVLDATKEPSKMLGYGIIREDNNSGGIIGPIYADNDTICEFILAQLISKFELDSGKIFSVMPLNSNTSAIEILRKIGFVQREECSRLFTKYVPKAGLSNKIYYVHSPNFSLF